MDKDINELRNEINSIDREFVELFIKRMGVSLSVAEYKKKTGMPVLDRSRERELLNRVAKAQVKSGYLEMANVQIVSEMVNLISITRAYESNQKVVQTIDDTLDVAVNQIGRVQ